MSSIQLQSVLFNNSANDVKRSLISSINAFQYLNSGADKYELSIVLGDSSEKPVLMRSDIEELKNLTFSSRIAFDYYFFEKNLGSAAGHNLLASKNATDFIFILNPDVIVAPSALFRLIQRFKDPNVGLVESKQLPIEHPKDYDPTTGDTGWATTACALILRKAFQDVGGFDDRFFFLYCDDLDFSWRLRLNSYRVVHEPSSIAFHDKRLGIKGEWIATNSEKYYSAEAALFLAYKWSNPRRVKKISRVFRQSGDKILLEALDNFNRRIAGLTNFEFLDQKHVVADFRYEIYTRPRFKL